MKNTLLLLTLWSFTGFSQFIEQRPLEAGSEKHAVALADLDGDGLNDFIYCNEAGIQWRSNSDGEETFHEIHQPYSRPIENTEEWYITVAAEDIDGDGDIDIAFGTQGNDGPGIAWTENLGGGEFSEITIIVENVSMRRIYFEDLDADGDLDLIANTVGGVIIDYSHKIMLLENLGGGLFNTPVIIDEFVFDERVSNAGDMDGDGDLDLIIGTHDGEEILWYENLGAWTFSAGTTISTGVSFVTEIHATDIDEDGDLDILYSAFHENQLAWIENVGGGTFGATEVIHTCNKPTLFRMEDVDDDADLDIVFVWREDVVMSPDSYLNVLEKTGPGTYAAPISVGSPVDQMHSFLIGDIDTDGVNDILFAGVFHQQYSYVLNEGGLTYSDSKVITGKAKNTEETLFADLNGDGHIDVLCYSYYYGLIHWMANSGDGAFGVPQPVSSGTTNISTVIIMDVDDDADMDLIISNLTDSTISWLPNLGDGSFGSSEIIDADPKRTQKMFAADLDLDGDSDLIRVGFNGGSFISYYENLGGTFSASTDVPSTATYVLDAEMDDIDADGDLDLVLVSGIELGDFLCYENTGGVFAAEVNLGTFHCQDFALADLNNDGNLDIVGIYGSDWADNEAFWMENSGDLTFGTENVFLVNHMEYKQIITNDINNDGDVDVLIGGSVIFLDADPWFASGQITWIENIADGTFGVPNDISHDILNFHDMSMVDIDADGDQDIFAVGSTDDQISWFKNAFSSSQQVSGNLYYDENENGIRDVGELGLGGIQVTSEPTFEFSYTYVDGNYIINFEDVADGDYTVLPEELDHWGITSDPMEYLVTVDDAFDGAEDFDFGFFPTDDDAELESSFIAGFPRCGTIINYYVAYMNIGGSIASGTIEIELDEDITYIGAEVAPDSIVDNSYYWSYADLFYFDEEYLEITIEIPGPEMMSDTLTSYSTVTALDDLGAALFAYEDSISQTIQCAYDPNDKTVSPKGDSEFGNIPPTTPFLEYTVRFQNTGTDTAINVVINDQLDENLDWSSLEILGNSDPMVTYIDHLGKFHLPSMTLCCLIAM
ncbi:MAG: hypothetical protein ACI8ZM_004419 [Crocinitomix sp.]|jgi:hypothetical protein